MRMPGIPALFTFLLCTGSLLAAQNGAGSARAVLESARHAAGGGAWKDVSEILSEGTLKAGSNTGFVRYLEDLRSGRNVLRYEFPSGTKGSQGSDIGRTWQQDGSGYISISDDPKSRQDDADDLYLTRLAYWQPNFGGAAVALLPAVNAEQASYDRVEIHPQGGHGFTLWISRQTHLIERVEHNTERPYTEIWSDYRDVSLPSNHSSVRMPYTISIEPGGQKTLYTVRKLLKKTRQADFAIPFRHDYELPKDGKATVPFFSSTGIILKAKINGQGPFAVILDSGSEINLISARLARQLHLKTDSGVPLSGLAGRTETQSTSVQSVQIGGLVLHNQQFLALDVPYGLTHDWKEPLVAAIGYPAFRQLAIQINYQQNETTFYDGPTFRYQGSGTEVQMHPSDGWLVADGAVQGVPGTFSLDTGQENVSLTLFRNFLNRTKLDNTMGERFCGVSGESFGGLEHACFARCDKLALGSVEAHDLVTQLLLDTKGVASEKTIAGNIGTGFFRKFTVTFDAIHQKLFLEKNADYSRPDVYNRAGLVLELVPQGDKVLNVFAGGPAAAAGIEVGDVITSIDGYVASDPAFSTMENVLRKPVGTVVQLIVQHGQAARNLQLKLQNVL